MGSKKRIIFFVTNLQSGGIENYLLRFIEECHENFIDITVFCKAGSGGQLEAQYRRFPNVRILMRKIGYFSLGDQAYLHKLFRRSSFDVVCDFTGNFAGLILRRAKGVGIKKRIAFYRNSSNRFKMTWLKYIYDSFVRNLVLKNATEIFANSETSFNYYFPSMWKKDSRFEVIYNGINSAKFLSERDTLREELGIPDSSFVIGHVGRFNAAKNHNTIVAVAKLLLERHNNMYFILCGNGVKENLQSLVDNLDFGNRIQVFENRSDISKFLNTVDCFYFPSTTEGQPNALIEAMVMGVPIVTSDIGSIRETIPRAFHSELIPPMDVDAAVGKILKIYHGDNKQDLQKWAIKNFDSKIWFNVFLRKLI